MLFTPASFAAHLLHMKVQMPHARHRILEKAAKIVEKEAKRVIGTYDYGWPPLAESTVARKGADTPLLETGVMRDSITHNVSNDSADIGTNDEKAKFHEYGTSRGIPPRPFMSGAIDHKIEEIKKTIGHEFVHFLSTGSPHNPKKSGTDE